MAKFQRLEVYNTILQDGLVPLFYQDKAEIALALLQAVYDGGGRVLEFTNRGEKALPVFATLIKHVEEHNIPLIIGVGSVVDAPTAAIFISQGANFIVGPSFNPDIARLCNRRKIAYLPGCGTVTEINTAEEAGVEIVKVFPGETLGGPAFIKAVLGPLPWSRIMPTGGVDARRESVHAWIKAGACCVGMGSNLVKKEWVSSSNYQAISQAVASILAWVKEARA